MILLARLLALVTFSSLLVACGGSGSSGATAPPSSTPLPATFAAQSGVAQKGPLIKGSTVTAQELDATLAPTGKQYSYQTTSDLGTFAPNSKFNSAYIGVSATGYYFDEIQNGVSGGPVTLNGYANLATDTTLNVNLLSTLAYQRIQNLVANSKFSFTDARTQAEAEVLAALNIPKGTFAAFTALDLSGNSDGDHILAAVSSLFVYGNASGPLSALIASVQSDIGANGKLTVAASEATLAAAAKAVDPAVIAANLTQRYSSAGVTFTAADIAAWIDQDGDGVLGKFKFQVTDATPASAFTLPGFVVDLLAGSSVSVTAGQLSVNGTPASGPAPVSSGDVIIVSPGTGPFPSGVLTVYVMNGTSRVARVSFVNSLVSIAVTPATPSVPNGLTQQFKATGTFSDTSVSDLSGGVSWTSSAPSVATVNATTGLALAAAVGSAVITATSGSVSGNTTLGVTPAVLESIAIMPDPAFAGIGVNTQLTATGSYSDGTTADVTATATWVSNTPSVATVVSTTGLMTGVTLGSTTISASIGSSTASVAASVTNDRWYPEGSMSSSEHCRHTATLLSSGKVLVTGGSCSGTNVTASAELYDPTSNTWSSAGNMAAARYWHAATLLPNGKVLLTGGNGSSVGGVGAPVLQSAELYDPTTNAWSSAGSMSAPHTRHTATLLASGKVLVAGGSGPNGYSAVAELYDPSTGIWTAIGNMVIARDMHSASLLPNGRVLVAGGEAANSNVGGATAAAELYDPTSETWSATADMHSARLAHTATLLGNGKVLVAAGFTSSIDPSAAYAASAEFYDPVANIWNPAASLSTGRDNHTATLLGDGTVLVAGGNGNSAGFIASAERYDPTVNTWSSAGSLATGRANHTATLLQTGAVLVTGGFGGGNSSELY
jgi:N-acetylneuraminic acid mutarotase